MGIFKTKGPGKLTPEQRQAVATDYVAGASLGSLARQFGIKAKSVKGLLAARNVPIRPYAPQAPRRRKHPKSPAPVHERWATKQVELAVLRGEIIRPRFCSECYAAGRVHGHHDDYNRPLAVRWLCSRCHADWHSLHIPTPSTRTT